MREGLQPEERPAGAHEETHRGAALQVRPLRHGLHAEEQHEAPREAGPPPRRSFARLRRPPGAGTGGAEPDPSAGGGGAGVGRRVAGPGQCVLTLPDGTWGPRVCSTCCEEQSTWNFCFEASSVKNVITIVFSYKII